MIGQKLGRLKIFSVITLEQNEMLRNYTPKIKSNAPEPKFIKLNFELTFRLWLFILDTTSFARRLDWRRRR